MLATIKSAIKNSAIYGLGNIATKLVGFLLLPIYMDTFSVSEYGALGLIEATSQVIIVLFGFNIYAGFTRWYFEPQMVENKKQFFSTVFIFLFASILVVLVFLTHFSSTLSLLIFNSESYIYLLKLMFIASCAEILSQLILTVLKLEEKSVFYTVLNISKLLINLGLTLYFVVVEKQGLEGIYHAQLYGHLSFFLLSFPVLKKNFQLTFNRQMLQSIFSYSFPLMLSSVSLLVLTQVDRYMLGSMKALSSVGEYSLGFKFANSIKVFLIFSVQMAISPMIYRMIDKPGSKRFYSKIMTYFTFAVIPFSLIISIFGGEVISFISKNSGYQSAEKVIPIISLAIIFGMLKDTAAIGINIKKKTKIIAITTVAISILNVGLNYFLIPIFDTSGAAFSTLICQIIFFVSIYSQAQKCYHIPYELRKIILLLVLAITLYLVSLSIKTFLGAVYINTALILSFPAVLYFFNFYDDIEILTIKKILRKII